MVPVNVMLLNPSVRMLAAMVTSVAGTGSGLMTEAEMEAPGDAPGGAGDADGDVHGDDDSTVAEPPPPRPGVRLS